MSEPSTCWWCRAAALYLCDTVLRGARPDGSTVTCDAKMCSAHAEPVARAHALGRTRRDGRPSALHRCPYCRTAKLAHAVRAEAHRAAAKAHAPSPQQ